MKPERVETWTEPDAADNWAAVDWTVLALTDWTAEAAEAAAVLDAAVLIEN